MVKEVGRLIPFKSMVDEEREEEFATDSKLNTFRKELGKKSPNNKTMDPIEHLMVHELSRTSMDERLFITLCKSIILQ